MLRYMQLWRGWCGTWAGAWIYSVMAKKRSADFGQPKDAAGVCSKSHKASQYEEGNSGNSSLGASSSRVAWDGAHPRQKDFESRSVSPRWSKLLTLTTVAPKQPSWTHEAKTHRSRVRYRFQS
jgi:hypothetical protein